MRPRKLSGPGLRAVGALALLLLALGALLPTLAEAQQTDPPILERVVGLTLEDVTLEEALREIQRSTGIGLVYSPDLIPVNRTVSCPCAALSVAEALGLLLRGTGLIIRATETQLRILPAPSASNQPRMGVITGEVLSGPEGSPVRNALIQLSDGRGALTNEHGRFILVNVPPGSYSLEVTGLGWNPARVDEIRVVAGGTATVAVTLIRRVIPLSAIVVSPGTFGILDDVSEFALQTLTRGQIETVPQLGEDVFRSLKRLPGVASGDISTKLHLRGGADREVLVRLDGMELYEPYHLKDFEGALGIVDINAIGGIDLHTGGFGVDFGNYMAGVFDMETRTPPTDGVRTTLGLSLTNATAMSQGAFAQGKGQWLFSARRGYLDIVMKLTDANDDISPRYYDILGKVKYQIGSKHLISAHILYAGDDLTLDTEALANDGTIGNLSTGWGNSYGWMTWKAFFSPRIRAQTVVSAGRISRSRIGYMEEPGRIEGPEAADIHDVASFDFAGLSQEWTVDFTDLIAARAGVSVKEVRADYDYTHWTQTLLAHPSGELVAVQDTVQLIMDPAGTEFGTFAALRFRPIEWATGEIGLRYDRHSHTGDSDFSPRLHALFDLGDRTTLRAAWGRYNQSQGIFYLEAADGETEFSPSEQATQIALGLERQLGRGLTGRIEVYRRTVDRPLRQYFNRWREILAFPEIEGDRIRIDPTEAKAKGLELLAQQDGVVWDWSASYSLSSTEDLVDGSWVPRFMDQRHAFTLTVGFRPSPKWTVTGAWQLHSGWPFTPQIIEFDTISVFQDEGLDSTLRWREEFGPLNSSSLPTYHRLDLRVTRRFELDQGALDVYLDIFNAYNQENLRSYDYGTQVVGNDLKYMRWPDEGLLPFLPSIGFRWEF
jgi:outer membrane receptor protein involved in Fe transport